MTTEYRPQTIAVLRAVKDLGPLSLRELQDMKLTSAKSTLVNLQTHRYVESSRDYARSTSIYSITRKGIRTLAAHDVGKGDVAGPRMLVSSAAYTGEPAKAQRPGAMQAFEIPSLHQGERIARKAPMLIGSIG